MALKKKITKDEHGKLSDVLKAEYIEDGDGFRLDVDGDEDTGALKRAKDREAQLRRDAEAKLKEAQEQLDALGSDDARKKGDIATLEKSWQKKTDDMKNEYEAKLSKLTDHTKRQLVDNVAQQIATKISNAPSLILPHIKQRLVADFDGDSPVTRVLDAKGQISALTIDDLSNEFVANKEFSAIITASKASGGATGKNQDGSAKNFSNNAVDFAKMKPTDMVAYLDAKKGN